MFLPYRSKNPPESMPFATIGLILVNTVVYAATSDHFASIKRSIVDQWALKSTNFDLLHLLTSLFLHGSPLHLIGNMFFLYLFGFAVEGRLKTWKFLFIYFVAGITGSLLHQALVGNAHPNQASLGASGAIMGVLAAGLYMFPHAKVATVYWFGWFWRGVFDCPLWGVALYYLGFDVLWALLDSIDGVAHFAHIGGALGGFLACMAFRPKRDDEHISDSKATIADTKDLTTLSRLQLSELHKHKPDDPHIVLAWMHRSLRDPGGPRPECIEAFQRSLPQMVREMDIRQVAHCVASLSMAPGSVAPSALIDMATRLERVHDNAMALRMYEAVERSPNASPADLESAIFRIGMLSESVYQNYGRAAGCYQQVIQRFPMSPFAEQAKARLAVVGPRAQQQAGHP